MMPVFTNAMNNRATDTMPLAMRVFLLALVICLHVAGAAAFSRLSGAPQHGEDPVVLQASWIEGSSPAPALLPQQPAKPLPAARPTPPLARPVQMPAPRAGLLAPSPSRLQTAAAQSAPAAVDAAPAVPANAQPNPDTGADTGVFAAVAAADGTVAGEGEGYRDGSYVAPDFNVSYFSNPEPEYPPRSRRLREQGLVRLRVHVTVEGRAGEVVLHTSSGYAQLDKAALDAVKHWRFRPARRVGMPVAGWVVVPIRFELQG